MKTIENPTANVTNEVVNQSIVTLNEFKNVKLSSIYSKKRPEAKKNRVPFNRTKLLKIKEIVKEV